MTTISNMAMAIELINNDNSTPEQILEACKAGLSLVDATPEFKLMAKQVIKQHEAFQAQLTQPVPVQPIVAPMQYKAYVGEAVVDLVAKNKVFSVDQLFEHTVIVARQRQPKLVDVKPQPDFHAHKKLAIQWFVGAKVIAPCNGGYCGVGMVNTTPKKPKK